MQSLPKKNPRPETRIARDCDMFLKARGWQVKKTHGNRFQKGFPDRYVFCREYGSRWIDYKCPTRNCLTLAQQREWPEWDAGGAGIWILTDATDVEYRKLFGPPNWREFWKPRYGALADVDALLIELGG